MLIVEQVVQESAEHQSRQHHWQHVLDEQIKHPPKPSVPILNGRHVDLCVTWKIQAGVSRISQTHTHVCCANV